MMPGPMGPEVRTEAARLSAIFEGLGAQPVDTSILQPADVLLDLYGEDIRARAYVTADPLRGEMMLRPDFTVPVVRAHMDEGGDPARYCYAGEVFRRQETDPDRPIEFLQAGFEIFGGDPAQADAEVFATIADALEGLDLWPSTGDIGILMAAVRGLRTSEARKGALLRHVWRPRRFRALLDRYGARTPLPAQRKALLAADDPFEGVGPVLGLRTRIEIETRIATLRDEARTPPISEEEMELIDMILDLRETAPNVLSSLRDIAVDMPAIGDAVTGLTRRLDAMSARGVDVQSLPFEGIVFGFQSPTRADLPPVATGGRYDALTRQLGQGRAVPAVGGVIRPELVVQIREGRA